jgi:hypothetical protein
MSELCVSTFTSSPVSLPSSVSLPPVRIHSTISSIHSCISTLDTSRSQSTTDAMSMYIERKRDTDVFSTSTTISLYSISSAKNSGRLPGLCSYERVKYKDTVYAVITIQHKKSDVRFVIDDTNLDKVMKKAWHLSSNKYIATTFILEDGTTKEIYLHNFLKERITIVDGIEKDYVIHINGNYLDNRLENLRIVDSDEYHSTKSKRKRTITLPADCGFLPDDIPRYISFMKANGDHGDRFVLEVPKLNIFRKLSSSKKIPLKEKLEEAKKLLKDLFESYPELNPEKDLELKTSLLQSYNEILTAPRM